MHFNSVEARGPLGLGYDYEDFKAFIFRGQNFACTDYSLQLHGFNCESEE